MPSEIPQLDVVTAIADSEHEDYLSQLLYSQGWNIIFRALDGAALEEFIRQRPSQLRTILVYRSDLDGFSPELLARLISLHPGLSAICLDGISQSAYATMKHIRQELRAPLLAQPAENSYPERLRDRTRPITPDAVRSDHRINSARRVIAVTGSAGAPGRTRFAQALAQEIARNEKVILVDADLRSPSLSRNSSTTLQSSAQSSVQVAPLNPSMRPTRLPDGDRTLVVDLGILPALGEAVTDRRWQGALINNVLESSTHLIYITKSTPAGIEELATFLREIPVLQKKLRITYLCILAGHSRSLREWEAKFLSLTIGENRHILREAQLDLSEESALLPFLKGKNPAHKEIGKILSSIT